MSLVQTGYIYAQAEPNLYILNDEKKMTDEMEIIGQLFLLMRLTITLTIVSFSSVRLSASMNDKIRIGRVK